MPDIRKYFPNSKVTDWTGGSFGAGGGSLEFYGEGGNVNIFEDPAGQLWISHEMVATGNFTVKKGSGNINYCIVGGGGGGGGSPSQPAPWGVQIHGGGGGGGYGEWADEPVSVTGGPGANGVYPIVIGAGGPAGPPVHSAPGSDSSAFGNTRNGGGCGGTSLPANSGQPYWTGAGDGASGGGGSYNQWGWSPTDLVNAGDGNTPALSSPEAPVQGHNGAMGAGNYSPWGRGGAGGGGGGAGGAGSAGSAGPYGWYNPTYANYGFGAGGAGGVGKQNTLKSASGDYYGGGGGGCGTTQLGLDPAPYRKGGAGGAGGGGNGFTDPSPVPWAPTSASPQVENCAGTANTGGGGGAGTGGTAGAGGSGVVVIAYKA